MKKIVAIIKSTNQKYNTWKKEHEGEKKYQINNFFCNLILSLLSVVPLMYYICMKVPFAYEVNDDSAIIQILSGAYTGTPDGHAVFFRYPLSWVIKTLYQYKKNIHFLGTYYENVNWYVVTFVVIQVIAMVAVLFRLLNYFNQNRLLICALFSVGFLKMWFPCFATFTFSTVGAFVGCMALMFFFLESDEEALRPWNILLLCFLIMCAYSLRKQCFYMIAPFLMLEFIRKYHINILKKASPWILLVACGSVIIGSNYIHSKMYSSLEWKKYMIYNQARGYMQDFGGFPSYEKHEDFYKEHNISKQEAAMLSSYRYCLMDDMNPELIEDMYLLKKAAEPKMSMFKKIWKYKGRTKDFLFRRGKSPGDLKYTSFFLCFSMIAVIPLSIITFRKKGFWYHMGYLFTAAGSASVLLAEWFYIGMKGRFPKRVEETMRLMMLSVGLMLLCQYLKMWEEESILKLGPILQVLAIVLIMVWASPMHIIQEKADSQTTKLNKLSDKAEIIEWCNSRPENIYILDTNHVIAPLRPIDVQEGVNWFVSGSWIAYSPLYKEKLAAEGLTSLGSDALVKDNVYIITGDVKYMTSIILLGNDADKDIEVEIVDKICTQTNTFYRVYKVKKYEIKK